IERGFQRLIATVLDCEKPVIAGVNGTAAGGGMHLALASDLVIMAEQARFIEVFIRRAIIPDAGGAYLLPRLVGPQKAKELFFFGDDVPAVEAERIGLANKIVPRAELEKTLGEWAGRLAKMPTRAIAFTKWLTNRALETDRTGSFWDEAYAQELVTRTGDMQEGRASFIERRPPEFRGWWARCGRASSREPGDGRAARRSSRDRRHRADRVREGTARFGAVARVPGDLGRARRRRHRAG